jgi:hypothetical protein
MATKLRLGAWELHTKLNKFVWKFPVQWDIKKQKLVSTKDAKKLKYFFVCEFGILLEVILVACLLLAQILSKSTILKLTFLEVVLGIIDLIACSFAVLSTWVLYNNSELVVSAFNLDYANEITFVKGMITNFLLQEDLIC